MISDDKFNSFQFYLKGIVDEKGIIEEIRKQKQELLNLFRDLSWSELQVELEPDNSNSNYYSIYYPENVEEKIVEIKKEYSHLSYFEDVGQNILFEDNKESFVVNIQISVFDKRIDISGDGIPMSVRGLGLGCKLYRAILEHEDYISSMDYKLSGFGRMLWNSIRKSELFYTFFHENRGFCFASEKNPNEIIEILEDNIDTEHIKELLWDETFIQNNIDLVKQSSLSKLLK